MAAPDRIIVSRCALEAIIEQLIELMDIADAKAVIDAQKQNQEGES